MNEGVVLRIQALAQFPYWGSSIPYQESTTGSTWHSSLQSGRGGDLAGHWWVKEGSPASADLSGTGSPSPKAEGKEGDLAGLVLGKSAGSLRFLSTLSISESCVIAATGTISIPHFGHKSRFQTSVHPGIAVFNFNDPVINGNLRKLEAFCGLMIEARNSSPGGRKGFPWVEWSGNAIIHPGMTKPLLDKMRGAGYSYLQFGIENGSQKVLNDMRKGYKVEIGERVIRDATGAGIQVHANFMVGFPTETEGDFQQTLEFLKRNRDYIYKVNPSESFTSIDEGTYLLEHAADRYGVRTPVHSSFWVSQDGKNTYPERLHRFEILCQTAQSLGMRVENQYDAIRRYKNSFLAKYEAYMQRQSVATRTWR